MLTLKNKTAAVLLFISLLFFTSCGINELQKKAEVTATAYYKDLQAKNYTAALQLCSDKALTVDTKDTWTKGFEKNNGLLGELQSFTKTNGLSIATSTNVGTTVTLTYDVQWQYGKSQDSIVLIKEQDGTMKIYSYQWQHKEAKYLTALGESEKETGAYMDAIKAGNKEAATTFCSDAALKETPKDKWIAFFNNAENKLGKIESYAIIKDSSSFHVAAKGDAGEGNYYDVFVQSNRGGNKVMEKIVFFQKDYSEPIKLTGHFFL